VRKLLLPVLAAAISFAVLPATVRAADQPLPAVGQVATGFTLLSQDGTPVTLNSFHGKWVVLYFYPKDMTSSFWA